MNFELPPGFRFHPTDEELIIYYLHNHAMSRPCPASIIPEVNICKFDPWELPGKSYLREGEWYFFSPRDRKYPNGGRPNRATASGFWKATGTDKAIHSNSKHVGVKKALVFYRGRPPKGSKTEWIMHEYRLGQPSNGVFKPTRVDEWVLCRIHQKKQSMRIRDDGQEDCFVEETPHMKIISNLEENMPKFPRSFSLARLIEPDCSLDAQLFDELPNGPINGLFDTRWYDWTADTVKFQSADAAKPVGSQESSAQEHSLCRSNLPALRY
ncbi:NAC domain-containing protein 2-like [Phoenix dactylifera]|uniref:NAC domain-containing protein 2-like n=1 Tax=Phoenix dactylifera TaxID=42345 RepID=A0A8B9B375_PHODC|nr:NAC domain-containing protein 2-like [Phoenix dactylifera]